MPDIVHRRPDLREFVRRDPVLVIACALALLSCAAVPPDAGYLGYVDLRTLGLLFSLMTVMTGLTRLGVFRAACRALLAVVRGPRSLALALTLLAFFSSMLITNDVALVTFVPLALLSLGHLGSPRLTCFTVVMMTVAANLGSMATPVGNPQNLYLYSASHLPLMDFILLMLPYTAAALALLVGAIALFGRAPGARPALAPGPCAPRGAEPGAAPDDGEGPVRVPLARTVPWAVLFALALGAVARILPYQVPVIAAVAVGLACDRQALRHVDYALLLTFVAFFVFVGNMGRIGAVDAFIAQVVAGNELLVSIAASQVLSNVPAAILLSGFTSAWPALIVGTNVGGLGTLIASMASLISYKQVALVLPHEKGRYLRLFTLWNVAFLAVLTLLALLIG